MTYFSQKYIRICMPRSTFHIKSKEFDSIFLTAKSAASSHAPAPPGCSTLGGGHRCSTDVPAASSHALAPPGCSNLRGGHRCSTDVPDAMSVAIHQFINCSGHDDADDYDHHLNFKMHGAHRKIRESEIKVSDCLNKIYELYLKFIGLSVNIHVLNFKTYELQNSWIRTYQRCACQKSRMFFKN